MIKTELEGELTGLPADMTQFFRPLIDFMIKEVGEDPKDAIAFIDQIATEILQWEEEHDKDDDVNMIPAKLQNALPPNKEAKNLQASKTQGMVPSAPTANPTEGITDAVETTAGDKEGPQSLSMAAGG